MKRQSLNTKFPVGAGADPRGSPRPTRGEPAVRPPLAVVVTPTGEIAVKRRAARWDIEFDLAGEA